MDALIILGRNFQPGFDRKVLAEQRFHLSPQSRINALAGGMLHEAGITAALLLSTGRTGGSNMDSEARAMQSHVRGIFKDIPDSAFLLEENSIDTEENAREVKKILLQHPELQTVGLLSDPSHLERAVPTFEKNEIQVYPFDSLEILGGSRPEFIESYLQSELYNKTIRQDRMAARIQNLPVLSPITSRLLHRIALKNRNPYTPIPYMKRD